MLRWNRAAARGPGERRVVATMLVLGLIVAASSAAAQRPDLRAMSCGEAQALLAARGAVVMTTGQFTYERFVANAYFCSRDEVIRRAWVETGDRDRCQIGYRCELRQRRFAPN